MVNERYLVPNRHGASFMKTFFTEAVDPALICDFRCVPEHILLRKTQFSVLDLNIRITTSKDHNNQDC